MATPDSASGALGRSGDSLQSAGSRGAATMLDAGDSRLIDRLHGDLPLTDHPFATVGAELGMDEDEVLERLRRLLAQGVLTRFGPLYQIERAGGQFVLAALEVPPERFDAVAQIVNSLPEVAHNYRREHPFNMWFVVAVESARRADAALQRVAELTGLPVHAFPKEREYFVELKLPLPEPLDLGAGDRDGAG